MPITLYGTEAYVPKLASGEWFGVTASLNQLDPEATQAPNHVLFDYRKNDFTASSSPFIVFACIEMDSNITCSP
jgi:hypothetical protein